MATPHGTRAIRLPGAFAVAILIQLNLVTAPVRAEYHVTIVDHFFPGDRAFVDESARQAALVAFDAVDIDALEDLTAIGVTVVTIAGNSGVRMVNTYSFARGVITVGDAAPDPDGRWIACNALVDLVEQASFPIHLVCDRERPSFGYDTDGDRLADVSLNQVSSYRQQRSAPPRESRRVLRGSSFAAPTALPPDARGHPRWLVTAQFLPN